MIQIFTQPNLIARRILFVVAVISTVIAGIYFLFIFETKSSTFSSLCRDIVLPSFCQFSNDGITYPISYFLLKGNNDVLDPQDSIFIYGWSQDSQCNVLWYSGTINSIENKKTLLPCCISHIQNIVFKTGERYMQMNDKLEWLVDTQNNKSYIIELCFSTENKVNDLPLLGHKVLYRFDVHSVD